MRQPPFLLLPKVPTIPLAMDTLERMSAATGIPLVVDGVHEIQERFLHKVREQRRKDFLQFLARVVTQHFRDPPTLSER